MTDTTIASDKPPTDPRPPCTVCGSREHTTQGHHDNEEPTGGASPMGHHDNSVPTGTE
jgi:hypothetical protein